MTRSPSIQLAAIRRDIQGALPSPDPNLSTRRLLDRLLVLRSQERAEAMVATGELAALRAWLDLDEGDPARRARALKRLAPEDRERCAPETHPPATEDPTMPTDAVLAAHEDIAAGRGPSFDAYKKPAVKPPEPRAYCPSCSGGGWLEFELEDGDWDEYECLDCGGSGDLTETPSTEDTP